MDNLTEERKKINEAILNGEKINLEEIKDRKNLQLAEELTAKRENLNSQLDIIKENYKLEQQALKDSDDYKRKVESDYTTFLKWEIDKRVWDYNRLAEASRQAMESARQAGLVTQSVDNSKTTTIWTIVNNTDTDLQSLDRILSR